MSRVLDAVSALPRAAKWALLAVVFTVVYFLVIEPAIDWTRRVNDRADRIESNLRRDRELGDPQSPDRRLIITSRELFGSPVLPSDARATAETLYRVVDRVLKEHGVEDASISERSGRLTSEHLPGAIGSNAQVDRFILEVSFDASVPTALDVLAALEQAPEVSAIGRVRLDKSGLRAAGLTPDKDAVRVTVSPELWKLGSASGSSGGSTP